VLTARPLPLVWSREYFIGVCKSDVISAATLAQKAEALCAALSSPAHHASSFLWLPVERCPLRAVATEKDGDDDYETAFETELAMTKKKMRIQQEVLPPDGLSPSFLFSTRPCMAAAVWEHASAMRSQGSERPSHALDAGVSSWAKAQVDDCHIIVQSQVSKEVVNDPTGGYYPLADTGHCAHKTMAGAPGDVARRGLWL